RDAAAHENLDEARAFRGEDQIAHEGEVRPETGGGPVDGSDHRLLDLPDPAQQALRSGPHGLAGETRPRRRRVRALRPREVRSGAEALPSPRDHDRADLDVAARAAEL